MMCWLGSGGFLSASCVPLARWVLLAHPVGGALGADCALLFQAH